MKEMKQKYPYLNDKELRDKTYFKGNVLFNDYSTTSFSFPVTLFFPVINSLKLLISGILIITDDTET